MVKMMEATSSVNTNKTMNNNPAEEVGDGQNEDATFPGEGAKIRG